MLADDWKQDFLRRLNNLPRDGYERFAKDLLVAEGFQEVVVDHRKDGNLVGGSGVYRAALFGFGVRFLCVRNLSVTDTHIQILEMNVQSHGDRGLLISTGMIENNLWRHCQDKSNSHIDIVDGAMLCEVCRNRRHGLNVTPHSVEKIETNLRDYGKVKSTKVHATTRYCKAWQFMADRIYEDRDRDLCAEILEQEILGRRKLIGKYKEDLSASTQDQECFCTITVGEKENDSQKIVWLVDHGLSNNEKTKFLLTVAKFAFDQENSSKSASNLQHVENICNQIGGVI